jgi:hypothetical protein
MNQTNTPPEGNAIQHKTLVIGSINAADFRIGNYMRSKEWGGIGQIEGIEVLKTRIDFKVKGYIHTLEEGKYFDLEPIPLTGAWLVRLGLYYKKTELGIKLYCIDTGIDSLVFSKEGHWSIPSGKISWYMDRNFKSPEYVHQLQNLYYALTGKELEIDR